MKIISWNVNGVRSVYAKGFTDWVQRANPDLIGIQELKAQENQIPADLLGKEKYHTYCNTAQKKGYSGVAVFTKTTPKSVFYKLGHHRFDSEGRMVHLEFNDYTLINLYLPHGGRQKENLGYKLEVYEALFSYLKRLKGKVVLIGDFNIAHNEIDLARPKQNKNNIMFTLEERKQIDILLSLGYIDTFRLLNKEGGNYTWWPWRANARQRNIGWRIDYQFINKSMQYKLKSAFVLKDVKGSDHCPIEIVVQ